MTAPSPAFAAFCRDWSVDVRACRPYRAQTKGKVERPVRYVRENLVYGRTFLNDADLAQLSRLTGHIRTYTVLGGMDKVPQIARRYGIDRRVLCRWKEELASPVFVAVQVTAAQASPCATPTTGEAVS